MGSRKTQFKKGQTLSLERRKKISEGLKKSEKVKRYHSDPNYKELFRELTKLRFENPEYRKKYKEKFKKLWQTDKYRKAHIDAINSIEYKKLQSAISKRRWQSKEYRERVIKAILKGLLKRPTRVERKFINLIEKYDLPFNYCGDGSLLIGGKCPDFVENNGRKLCIEVSNKEFRRGKTHKNPEEYQKNRMEHFAKYGWNCLVLWEEELINEQQVLNKVQNFVKEGI
jgi:very-short-patch-repair endonuclease